MFCFFKPFLSMKKKNNKNNEIKLKKSNYNFIRVLFHLN